MRQKVATQPVALSILRALRAHASTTLPVRMVDQSSFAKIIENWWNSFPSAIKVARQRGWWPGLA